LLFHRLTRRITRMAKRASLLLTFTCAAALLAGCGGETAPAPTGTDAGIDGDTVSGAGTAAAGAFPDSLAATGDGYPSTGDPCRRLGESDATRNWLDDSADLVGCPTAEAAAALNGNILATVEGITVVSIPRQAMAAAGEGTGTAGSDDAMVPGLSGFPCVGGRLNITPPWP
jgi:hypothetical protein